MTVMEGGIGNLTLGPVTGFPTIASTLGTNKHFHYALLNTNLSPIEIGQGVMTNATTLQRDTVEAAMIAGEFITDGSKADVPVGAVMFTAPTANSLLKLVLEQKTVDYGNVSGAVTLDFKNACIVANITADTTFTVDTATLPPAGTHHEIILKLKSNNNPALTTPFQAGFVVTLGGGRFFIDGGVAAYPSMRLLGAAGSEMTLRLTNIGGGTNYRVENISKHEHVHNLGVVAGNITLDIRRPWNIGELTGSATTATINAISPDVGVIEPAHFTIVNNGSVTKTIVFNSNILSIEGSTLSQVVVPIGYMLDFDIRRNPLNGAVSYAAKVGDVNYNQTASGTDTRWNASNRASNITLTNNDYTAEMTTPSASRRSVKAFGFKSTGKWSFAVLCEQAVVGGASGTSLEGAFFVVNSSLLVTGDPYVAGMQYGGIYYQRTGMTGVHYAFGRTSTNINAPEVSPTTNSIIEICVDLTLGRGWICYNSTWVGGGNPETNTAPSFTFTPGQEMAITWTTTEVGAAVTSGIWRILTQIEKPNRHLYPSFPNWTS